MLNNKRLEKIEELEDFLIDRLQSFDDVQAIKLVRSIVIDIALLSPFELEENENAYLLAEKVSCTRTVGENKIEQLRFSVSQKIKNSIQSGQILSKGSQVHWIYRLIYVLVSEEMHSVSDQIELIFNTVDFCDLPLEIVREKIKVNIR